METLMTQNPEDLQRQIAELEAQLAALKSQAVSSNSEPEHQSSQGTVTANSSEIQGTVAGVISQSIINQFFGNQQPDDGEQLLQDYLQALMQDCNRLRLERMTEKRQTGDDQATTPKLKLQDVYTSLTTDGPDIPTCRERTRTRDYLEKLAGRLQSQIRTRTMDTCDPLHVRHMVSRHLDGTSAKFALWTRPPAPPPPTTRKQPSARVTTPPIAPPRKLSSSPRLSPPSPIPRKQRNADEQLTIQLIRPELALDAIRQHQRLVLLGEPGSGKSTVLRYLAVLLAQKLLSMPTAIPGWEQVESLPVPVLCQLGKVAEALTKTEDADQALWHTLEQSLDGSHRLRAGLLKDAMRRGAVLLLCDGLDELPQTSTSDDQIKPRRDIAQALRRLANDVPSLHIVLTSRVKPYHAASDWQMSREEDWETRTIQPLAFGQVQTFIQSWYKAVSEPSQTEDLDDRAQHLISELQRNERVGRLVESPLLLTMLTILHYNRDTIPRERVELYDECVELLLERWEPIRSSANPDEQRKLLARLGYITGLKVRDLRNVIHELAFEAHDQPPTDDGRGLIDGEKLAGKLLRFFARLQCDAPDQKVQIFRDVLEADAGLLQSPDHDRYTFPHLTFQEYLAACYLVDRLGHPQEDMATLAYTRWCSPDAERWREVLLLLIGRLRHKGGSEIIRDGVPWLKLLIATKTRSGVKSTYQRQRDLVLAALSYAEIDGRNALANWDLDVEEELEGPLRNGLVELLEQPDPQIGLDDRVAVANTLGQIGDPRFPITEADWQHEAFPKTFGNPKGYWCYIPAGTYKIGGWEENESAVDIELPEYWIARLPITVAQFQPFVEVGYNDEAQHWWTPRGWRWKQQRERTEPWRWGSATWGGPNQPVIGVNWYEGMAFVNWLDEQLTATLPEGYRLRLPTEAEWEAAAAYDGSDQRRTYPWGNATPTWEHAVYDMSGLQQTAPVGCCAKGQAACGALDMVGNIWEWVASQSASYPQESHQVVEDLEAQRPMAPIRGRGWDDRKEPMFCGARHQDLPVSLGHLHFHGLHGLRVVVSLR